MNLKGNWNYPTLVRFGAGRIAELPQACATLGIEAPLLVTDPGLAKLPMIASAVSLCTTAGLKVIDVAPFVGGEEPPAQPRTAMDDLCGYCVLATPLPVVLALLFALLLCLPQTPAFHFYSLLLKAPRNMRGLGSQAPPIAL